MLASLLAKQPSKTTPIPPIPTSVISATPQDKLPKIVDRLKPAGKNFSLKMLFPTSLIKCISNYKFDLGVGSQWSGSNLQNPGAAGPGRPQAPATHPNAIRGQRQSGNQFLSQILNQQQDHQQVIEVTL